MNDETKAMEKIAKSKLYVCPACSAMFTETDLESAGGAISHCLNCDHHYPPEDGKCHNCGSDNLVSVVETELTMDDLDRLCTWHTSRNYPHGMDELLLPDGRRFRGGVEVVEP